MDSICHYINLSAMVFVMKRSKYKNIKTVVDGIKFDSKKEARRYQDLKILERAGEIFGLELQPRFSIIVNGFKICTYVADFRYYEEGNPNEVIEDVKGVKTAIYRLKNKLMQAVHGIEILET